MTARRVPTAYSTISAAVAAAAAGDTIIVATGYAGHETVGVSVNNLTVSAPATAVGIVLNLAPAVRSISLTGAAPITVNGSAARNVMVDSGSGITVLRGGTGNDTITVNGGDLADGGGGDDTIGGIGGKNVLYGRAGDDTITTAGSDTVDGGTGNDTIIAALGAGTIKTLRGGDGNDLFRFADNAGGKGTVDGGAGIDTVRASDLGRVVFSNVEILDGYTIASFSATVAQLAAFAKITASQTTAGSRLSFALSGGGGTLNLSARLPVERSVQIVDYGLTGGITVTGTAYGDDLQGSTLADTLSGGAGDDTINGGDGSNILKGGDGNDTISAFGKDTVDGGSGNDTILEYADTFTSVKGGDGNDLLVIRGTKGSVDGGAGVDTIQSYEISKLTLANIEILDTFGQGGINGAVSATVGQLAAFKTITNSLGPSNGQFEIALSGTGGKADLSTKLAGRRSVHVLDNGLTGGVDVIGTVYGDDLQGSIFADTLSGGAGNDTIDGGGGINILKGGDGNDTITVNGKDTVDAGSGNDTIIAGVEFTALKGGVGNDVFVVRAQKGAVDGGAGIDTIQSFDLAGLTLSNIEIFDGNSSGGGGGGMTATIAQINGFATITDSGRPSNSQFTVDLRGAGGTLDLSAKLPGNRSVNVIGVSLNGGVNLVGTAYGDDLQGSIFADTLSGGAGNDTIDGGGGINILKGGDGNDTITVNGKDTVDAGSGNDTIIAGVEFTALKGGVGNDVFVVRAQKGAVDGGAGIDTIQSFDLAGLTLSNIEIFDGASSGDGGGGMRATIAQINGFATITDSGRPSNSQFTVDLRGAGGTLDLSAKLPGKRSVNVIGVSLNGGVNLVGTAYGDDVYGSNYHDDILNGGAGDDILNGGLSGDDRLIGGDGNDTAVYDAAFFQVGVTVSLAVSGSQNTLGAGRDTLIGIENLTGTQYADVLTGNAGNNVLDGNLGYDILIGGAGADTLRGGGEAADRSTWWNSASYATATKGVVASLVKPSTNTGDAAGDTYSFISDLIGSSFNDVLTGDLGNNGLHGGAGNDILDGGDAGDVLDGGEGNDTVSYAHSALGVEASLHGGFGDRFGEDRYNSIENLTGSRFADVLTGDFGNNRMNGKAGADKLFGEDGDDRLQGGGGKDILTGGDGRDTFVLDQPLVAGNLTTITDFTPGSDVIALSLGVFVNAGSAAGTLNANAFFAGGAAHDGSDRILYNSATGSLLYDSDGTGSTAAVAIAKLGSHLSVTGNDFKLF